MILYSKLIDLLITYADIKGVVHAHKFALVKDSYIIKWNIVQILQMNLCNPPKSILLHIYSFTVRALWSI
jgi:hypothetical protein